MKPSKKIKELFDRYNKSAVYNNDFQENLVELGSRFEAIISYLDEEWEKRQPCKHEDIEKGEQYDVCKKCGCIGYFDTKHE